MDEQLLIQLAMEELQHKNFAVSEQLLEVVEIEYKNGAPIVAKVLYDHKENSATVYFAVKGERFYFAVYLDLQPVPKVRWVDTDTKWHVYFTATSKSLDLQQLSTFTTVPATGGWNKGEKKGHGNSLYTFSRIIIDPFPGPGTFEWKFDQLLDLLEQDREGILKLVREAHGYILVAGYYHNATGRIGGVHLTTETISRMAALELAISIDQYVGGNQIKDEFTAANKAE